MKADHRAAQTSLSNRSGPFMAAIFDMDGLLLDSERAIMDAWQQAAQEHGASLSSDSYLPLKGRRAADVRGLMRGMLPPGFAFDAARARVQELIALRRRKEGFVVKPGARALLTQLQAAEVPCAVASSTRREEVERRLSLAGLAVQFQALVGGDEVEHGKPAPDIFLLAAARLGRAPRQCLVFEDIEHGARAAIAAGMQVVIVPDLKQPSAEARAFSLAVLGSLEEVALVLDARAKQSFVFERTAGP